MDIDGDFRGEGFVDRGRYQAVLRPVSKDWLTGVERATNAWLVEKKIALDMRENSLVTTNDRRVRLIRHANEHGSGFRLSMDEETPNGRFITTILAVADKDDPWLMVRVLNDKNAVVPSPRLARDILSNLKFHDGLARVGAPITVTTDQIDALIDRLNDPSRRGAVFAIGTSDRIRPTEFESKLVPWFRDAIGMGQAVILTPEATEEFAKRAGSFAIPEAAIRTFGPGLSLDQQTTAKRHRILGTTTLATTADRRIRALLGYFARTQANRSVMPATVVRWQRTFDHALNESIHKRLIVAPGEKKQIDQAAVGFDEADRIKQLLGLEDLEDATLLSLVDAATRPHADPGVLDEQAQRIAELQRRVDLQDDDLTSAKKELGGLIDEARDAADRASDAEDRLRRLERAVRSNNLDLWSLEAQSDSLPPEAPDTPTSWIDLWIRKDQWAAFGVIITAARDPFDDMDEIDLDGRALDAAYEGLRSLAGYARARNTSEHDGDYSAYLTAQPVGYPTYPLNRYAFTETKWTKDRHGAERIFPVPDWVDKSGERAMHAHLKLTRLANKDPRLHFIDAMSNDNLYKVVVGYIGPHLTNRATSRLN